MIYLKENLKQLRILRSFTQQEFSDLIGIKKNTYGNYETGYSTPDFLILKKISKILGFSVDELLFRPLYNKEALQKENHSSSQKHTPHTTLSSDTHALLAAKDEIIASKQETIDAQKQTISMLEEKVQTLKRELGDTITGIGNRAKRSA